MQYDQWKEEAARLKKKAEKDLKKK